ncbi:hypothetical protein QE152_g29821 [Popillia japonica]|uniref:Uncharacterized protein n=1 Tax=Popillia japonica TaxID=7064 RepID=A0AAW1JG50_POPJA
MPGGVRPSREGLRDPKDGGGRAVLGTKSAHIPNVFMQCVCATSTEDLRSDVLAPSKGVAEVEGPRWGALTEFARFLIRGRTDSEYETRGRGIGGGSACPHRNSLS